MDAEKIAALPKTRAEAMKSRSKHYYNGEPCVNGHLSPRTTLHSHCVQCRSERNRVRVEPAIPLPKKLITRQQASFLQLKYYFSGEPCVNGHLAPRYVSNNECVECKRAANLAKVVASLPATREEARRKKAKRFFTGVPCEKGHLAPRYVGNGQCVECRARYSATVAAAEADNPTMPAAAAQPTQWDERTRVNHPTAATEPYYYAL